MKNIEVKKYIDLEELKRDFTIISRQFSSSFNYKPESFNNVAVVLSVLTELNDWRLYFECLNSMLQQVQNDFPAEISSQKNIARNRLLKDLKDLGQQINNRINDTLSELTAIYENKCLYVSPMFLKTLTFDSMARYNVRYVESSLNADYDKKQTVDYTIFRLFNVRFKNYIAPQLVVYIRTVNKNSYLLVQDQFVIPGFENLSAYINWNGKRNLFDDILKAQGLIQLDTNEIPNIDSIKITSQNGNLYIPIICTLNTMNAKVNQAVKAIRKKLSQYKINLTPVFKFRRDSHMLIMEFGDVVLSEKSASIIQKLFGLSPRVIDDLIVGLENKSE